MEYYIKIKGDLNPVDFMNHLVNKIVKTNEDKCQIEERKNKLKFDVIFENEEEEEEEENIENEENSENQIDDKDNEKIINKKESVIKIELFKYDNKDHLLRFMKKSGEIEDYYKNLKSIYTYVEELL